MDWCFGHHGAALDGTGEVDQRVDQFVARPDYNPRAGPTARARREGEGWCVQLDRPTPESEDPVMKRAVVITLLTLAAAYGVAKAEAIPSSASASVKQTSEPIIAFERTGNVYIMNADGTDQRKLTAGYGFEWSPDGTRIAFHRSSGVYEDIWVIARDGSDLRRVVRNRSAGDLTWSADGKQIAFTGGYTNQRSAIFVVNSDGTGLARLTSPTGVAAEDMSPDWSPDGTQIAFERNKVDVSDQGGNDKYFIITMKPDGSEQRVLTRGLSVERPVWSQDGSRIAFHVFLRPAGRFQRDIYLMTRDGSGQQNVTETDSPSEYEPRWSPDGRTIVFESRSGRNFNVHSIRADGTRHVNLARSPRLDDEPEWSPDGRSIVFVSNRDGNRDIYVMTAAGRNQTNLTNSPIGTPNTSPAWSPLP